MAVVAIIGVLSTIAIVALSSKRHGRTPQAFAHQVSSVFELARMRAIATHKRQRVDIGANAIIHKQGTTQGMTEPATWDVLRELSAPNGIEISSLASRTHVNSNDSVPANGTGMTDDDDAKIDFLPDGSSEASTVFIRDLQDKQFSRVTVYGLSGTSYVFSDW